MFSIRIGSNMILQFLHKQNTIKSLATVLCLVMNLEQSVSTHVYEEKQPLIFFIVLKGYVYLQRCVVTSNTSLPL